jgi:hypothetical protein
MTRRNYFTAISPLLAPWAQLQAQPSGPQLWEEYLRASAVARGTLDRFLSGPAWARFDPELGYVLSNYLPAEGVDGSSTMSTIQPNGARTSFAYVNRPCRINTYGDSFTLCHQVSDGETWQEYLAAHLGEPVRNFGMGGYGVYQAWRRLLREEQTSHAAEYLIFYIWGDDHIRSLLRCRHALIYRVWDHQGGGRFHNNFWANLEMDPGSGQLIERPNRLPTRDSLYRMTDPQWMVDNLGDDLALHLYTFVRGFTRDLDRERISRLAAALGHSFDWNSGAALREQAVTLLDKYSLRATRYILDRVSDFASRNRKKLLVVLFDPGRAMRDLREGKPRYDQEIVDYLKSRQMRFFDMNEVHLRDFAQYRIPFADYLKLYFIGHYNPRGNHFFAHSIKDTVIDWLEPKPVTYQKRDPKTFDYSPYLGYER